MAIAGEGFGVSSRKSMFLHMKHLHKFDRAMNFTNLYLTLSKLSLVILNLLLMVGIMKLTGDDYRISGYQGPGFFVVMITYFVSDFFMGFYEMIA